MIILFNPVVSAQKYNPTTEFEMPTGIHTKAVKTEIETLPVTCRH